MINLFLIGPYASLAKLRESRGWIYSGGDEASLPGFVDAVRERDSQPKFGLVVAVTRAERSGSGAKRERENVIQLRVGDLYFVVGAYRIRLDASYDHGVKLTLSAALP